MSNNNNEQLCQRVLTYLICFDIVKAALSKLENVDALPAVDVATVLSDKFIESAANKADKQEICQT